MTSVKRQLEAWQRKHRSSLGTAMRTALSLLIHEHLSVFWIFKVFLVTYFVVFGGYILYYLGFIYY